MDPVMDQINRKAWKASLPDSILATGFTDPGESAALAEVEVEARNQPILDIGVGGGRTVPLLRRISRDYVAIDYIPELVLACRRRFPDARVILGDARDLSAFDPRSVTACSSTTRRCKGRSRSCAKPDSEMTCASFRARTDGASFRMPTRTRSGGFTTSRESSCSSNQLHCKFLK